MLEEREHPSPATAELTHSPTFSQTSGEGESLCDNSPQQISAGPIATPVDDVYGDDDDEEEFEFAFMVRSPESFSPITADDNFHDGKVRYVYPIFNRSLLVADGNRSARRTLLKLLNEERGWSSATSSSSSSTGDDLERIPRWTYCLWKPGAGGATKGSSSRESSLRWRILDLVIGRIPCTGKERFVFLTAKKKKSPDKVAPAEAADGTKEKGKRKKDAEIHIKEAHRVYHSPNSRRTSPTYRDGGGRKPYTPYKPDVVAFLGGVKWMGMFHHSC
ncbi:hypothetical protein HPP92_020279 [Vanilla planifolia]|uniref:Uncharacterized protein n=1 Tax=Vanilla planifolia TaxID=51239 RepID=A0A835Q100_VANPL|nr:hypothetical protein HPP92_020279 [Vanilla planifolia]